MGFFFVSACTGTITDASAEGEAQDLDSVGADADSGEDEDVVVEEDPERPGLLKRSFQESSEDILNPERGLYTGVDLLHPSGAAELRQQGHTLAIAYVRLDAYRDAPLDADFLSDLEEGFAAVRGAGVKVILRFAYNASFTADAPKSRILQHLGQLSPVLDENADVIAFMQAGFIGAWGEWHGSTNGLDNDTDRTEILKAILDALPPERMVQVRTPMFKHAAFGEPIGAEEAWTGTQRARVGHHNDCFLASDSDLGTYAHPADTWREYVQSEASFLPTGGETCGVYAPRTNCTAAVAEMEDLRWTYLNQDYHKTVIEGWSTDGCLEDIRQRLGYRIVLNEASYSESTAPGELIQLAFQLQNRGFSSPVNARPVYVTLSAGGTRWAARIEDIDPRTWRPGEAVSIETQLRLPADVPPGSYSLAIWLPDADPALAADSRYAIRLASDGLWDGQSGENTFATDLPITPEGAVPAEDTDTPVYELEPLP